LEEKQCYRSYTFNLPNLDKEKASIPEEKKGIEAFSVDVNLFLLT